MHEEMCICNDIQPLDLRTRVAIVWHVIEVAKTTNTGRVALATLPNSESYIRGIQDNPADLSPLLDPERRLLVLYPSDDAIELSDDFVRADPRPITLAVPDATWTQARRAVRREAVLAQAVKVIPPPGPPSRYHLRQTDNERNLSTIEAIARALGVIEGPHAQQELERIFDIMVQRTLDTRRQPPSKERPPGWTRRNKWVEPEVFDAWIKEQKHKEAKEPKD